MNNEDIKYWASLDTKALRKRVAALARPGDPATMSRMQAVTDEVDRAFLDASFVGAQLETKRAPSKTRIRVDIAYHPR